MKVEKSESINGTVVKQYGDIANGLRVLVDDHEAEGFAILYIVCSDEVKLKIQIDAVEYQGGAYVDISSVTEA